MAFHLWVVWLKYCGFCGKSCLSVHFPSTAFLFGPIAYKVEIVSTSDTNTVKQPELGCVDFRNTLLLTPFLLIEPCCWYQSKNTVILDVGFLFEKAIFASCYNYLFFSFFFFFPRRCVPRCLLLMFLEWVSIWQSSTKVSGPLSFSGFPSAPCSHFQSDCISFSNITLFNTLHI